MGKQSKGRGIKVVPYNEQWPSEFEKIRHEIATALGGVALSIEHVGSTSVAGLWAKPIIDIDVVIKDDTVLPQVINLLESVGYHYEGNLGIADRYAFCYETKPDLMEHHLYVCPQNSLELKRHIYFRNYLRTHPEAIDKYSHIKREGAALFPQDIDGYINYKAKVIDEINHECGL